MRESCKAARAPPQTPMEELTRYATGPAAIEMFFIFYFIRYRGIGARRTCTSSHSIRADYIEKDAVRLWLKFSNIIPLI